MITDHETGTTLDEVADGIYRISTPVPASAIPPQGFSFNRYLVVDEQPMLFHTGPRTMFRLTRDAVSKVLPMEKLSYVGLSHVEADECGALNELLAVAPEARPLCGHVAAMVSISDMADVEPRGLSDGETISLGRREMKWLDAPHMPHAWECGYLFDASTRTLLCGDLFTQGGDDNPAWTESDILGPSEEFRKVMDYYSHTKYADSILERLAETRPAVLACMHGSAWRGDGAALLRALAQSLQNG
jgi:flavorubredoxin